MNVANPVPLHEQGGQPNDAGKPILEMRGISKSFGVVKALSDVNFTVMPGRFTHLLAKTALANPRS